MTYAAIIAAAAKTIGVPGALLLAICTHETGLKNEMVMEDGESPTYGICQVKYQTAQMLGFKGEALDLMDPKQNAKYAAKYLKYQLNRYEGDVCKSVAAYNAGSYNESRRVPGKPRNLKYVNNVISKLEDPEESWSCQ